MCLLTGHEERAAQQLRVMRVESIDMSRPRGERVIESLGVRPVEAVVNDGYPLPPDMSIAEHAMVLYIASGNWRPAPKYTSAYGLMLKELRYLSSLMNNLASGDPKKIAAAVRRADKQKDGLMAWAIAREAKRRGLDPKVKQYDF
jgi:hypothetical protein